MIVSNLKWLLQNDEAAYWNRIEQLRCIDISQLLGEVEVGSRDHAISRGVEVVRRILWLAAARGLDFNSFCPGHGSGHIVRDYVNALRLLTKLDADPRELFIGFVAGVLHDLSCGLVDRYAESGRAVRHAEAGAIMVMELAGESYLGLSDPEIKLVAYAIAAHTHYLKESVVHCKDGIDRTVSPYRDVDPGGNPYLCVWIPRWIDRLDCSGPTFVARNFLTLRDDHEDYGHDEGHFQVRFRDYLRPVLPTTEEIRTSRGGQTMLGHFHAFAMSQNNNSPYGKFDRGAMVPLRDTERAMLFSIIETVRHPWSPVKKEDTMRSWERFLRTNIERTSMGARYSRELCVMFRELDELTQVSWCSGFHETMRQYSVLASQIIGDLEDIPPEFFSLAPIAGDVRTIIKPAF